MRLDRTAAGFIVEIIADRFYTFALSQNAKLSKIHVFCGFQYYALKGRPIYRSYPMYYPGREPKGYIESLKQKEPEIVFDASRLR
jgi:hypothetical protein